LLLIELSIHERQPEAAVPHLDAIAAQLNPQKAEMLKQRVDRAPRASTENTVSQSSKEPAKTSNDPPAVVPKAPSKADSRQATKSDLESLWTDLEQAEAVAARALLKMAARPEESVAFLKGKLKPLMITTERVQTLLVNLGSENEETWKAAYEELEYFDPRLAIDLPTLMNDVTTAPARQRMVEIMSQRPVGSLDGKEVTLRPLGSSDGYNFFDGRGSWWAEHRVERLNAGFGNMKKKWTQAVRALVLLEHIGSPAAKAILRDMASGHADAQPTKQASEALKRLDEKTP
jgi:hypothetical protein